MPGFHRTLRKPAEDRNRENPEKVLAQETLARPGNDPAGIRCAEREAAAGIEEGHAARRGRRITAASMPPARLARVIVLVIGIIETLKANSGPPKRGGRNREKACGELLLRHMENCRQGKFFSASSFFLRKLAIISIRK